MTVAGLAATLIGKQQMLTNNQRLSMVLYVGGIVLGLGSFAWLCLRIKCPKCRAKIFWSAASRDSLRTWWNQAFESASCPACGYNPRDHSSS